MLQKLIDKSKLTKGQVIPIIVLMMFAILGMAALLVDGGSIMMDKRVAQAAADAGALAGARALCYSSGGDPLEVANEFALANGAETSDAQYVDGLVSVTTTVTKESYFAKIFNEQTIGSSAVASAGCFAPAGMRLCRLPGPAGLLLRVEDMIPIKVVRSVPWIGSFYESLKENEVTPITIPGNDGQYVMSGNDIVNMSTNKPPTQIYIIMDDVATRSDLYCIEDPDLDPDETFMTCDGDGDGRIDIHGAGDRGWLDLDGGGGGASQIKNGSGKGLMALSIHIHG